MCNFICFQYEKIMVYIRAFPFPGCIYRVLLKCSILYMYWILNYLLVPNTCDCLHPVPLVGLPYPFLTLVLSWIQNMCLNLILLAQIILLGITYVYIGLYWAHVYIRLKQCLWYYKFLLLIKFSLLRLIFTYTLI